MSFTSFVGVTSVGFFGVIGRIALFLFTLALSVAPPFIWFYPKIKAKSLANQKEKDATAQQIQQYINTLKQMELEIKQERIQYQTELTDKEQTLEHYRTHCKELLDLQETAILHALHATHAYIDQHMATLMVQRNTKVIYDVYGNANLQLWIREIEYFIERVLKPNIVYVTNIDDTLVTLIESKVNERITSTKYIQQPTLATDGHAFEQECLDAFKRQGWNGYKTKGSGDQGADLVLNRNHIIVVVQCKLYSNKVSNAAVQEVYTAQAVYGAHYGVVITNSGYQPSAVQAAQKTGVFLLKAGMEAELWGLIQKRTTHV